MHEGGPAASTGSEPADGRIPAPVAVHLDAHREITLFCRDGRGHPVGYPMFHLGLVDRDLLFSTYAKSAKVRHLERDPRAALLSVATGDGGQVRWVGMTGTASVWRPTAEEIAELFPEGPGAAGVRTEGRVPETVGPLVRRRTIEGKRVVLRIALDQPGSLRVREARR